MSSSKADDREHFAEAIADANIPTLLMVLVQMTGDRRWLNPPYRPSRGSGLDDNDSGGLSEQAQAEVRAAALDAIVAWRNGEPVAIPDPDPELLVEMLSTAMGEPVPPEYGDFTAAQLGHHPVNDQPANVPPGFHVVVVGAGVSGICAAVNLKAAGIPFTVIEKNPTVGGVWYENHYPGAGVDTPNHLYSYSFAMHDWSMFFSLRDDLYGYLEEVVEAFDLAPYIRFNTEVTQATYDSSRQRWMVEATDSNGNAERLEGAALISATGIFNPPVYPKIDGLDTFEGPSFHSADWQSDVDLTDKRVAIIGNGASCMQIGPEIQNQVRSLTIFQRSPHWAAPFARFRRRVPDALRFMLREVPLYQAWYRVRLGWTFNDRLHTALQKDPDWAFKERSLNATNDAHRAYFTQYIKSELGDRTDLLDKVLPTYPPFGKRMLMDNGWYRMLRNERVQLVDDAIESINADSVVTTDGTAYDADVLVLATGFDVLRFMTSFDVIGRSGQRLCDRWDDDNAKAYMGTVIPDFPNFFMLYGPNLQPGHGGSLIFVVEMQVRYVMDILRKMSANEVGAVECRESVHDAYNERVDAAHEQMVWTHEGMTSYYRNARGRIVVNSPFRNVDFYDMTREANLDQYVLEPRK
ncbi:MAG: NAD(P)/FAD-dependent oxidoreductase [Gammaproteobacteria bacterium]|nr:NAD(P)/FAD-dependent oxidoreductase [Gammaproteobacteria bacterium]